MRKELEGVKAGDTIKVREQYGSGFRLYVVERVTETRAVCERASFMIESGVQVGTKSSGRWPTSKYGILVHESELATVRKEIETKRRISVAQAAIQRATVTEENLVAAEAFLNAIKKKEPA